MIKRRIVLAVLSALLIAVFIVPGLARRVQFEASSKTYTAAVDMTRVERYFERDELDDILREYMDAGVTTVLIHEDRGRISRFLLDLAKDAGAEIAIIPDLTSWLQADLENIVKEYGVKYIKLQKSTLTSAHQALGKIDYVSEVVDKYDLTLVLTEGGMQLGNVQTGGFDLIVDAADGNILRSFHSYFETNVDVMDYPAGYYQIYISSLDRNCRFITVKQLADEGFTHYENARRTMENVRLYCEKMESQGFVNEGLVNYNEYGEYQSQHPFIYSATAAVCILWLTLMIDLLTKRSFTGLGICIAGFAFCISLLLPESLTTLYPSLFAAFAPCFALAVVAVFIHTLKSRTVVFALIALSVAVTLAMFCVSGAVLSALLGGSDYFLNFSEFRGVKISLILPMIFALFLLVASVYKKRSISEYKDMALGALSKIRWYHIVLLALVAIVTAVYILRSGNVDKISFTETAIRNWFTEVFVARPRTKELLLGWPCMILYIYFVKNDRSKLLTWAFAIGASTLYASAVNTFCHVFTMVETMYLRVFVGALFGLPIAFIALGAVVLLLRAFDKVKK